MLSAEEAVKVGPDGVREPGTVLEDEVTKLSVAEVYRSGFGRHRSGASRLSFPISSL